MLFRTTRHVHTLLSSSSSLLVSTIQRCAAATSVQAASMATQFLDSATPSARSLSTMKTSFATEQNHRSSHEISPSAQRHRSALQHKSQNILQSKLSGLRYNFNQNQFRSYTIPVVLESGATGERSFDIYSRLLRERIICVHGEVTDQMASVVTAQLLFLEAEDPDSPLYMYINSPGGSVTAGMAMYDTMRYIRPNVHTIAMGQAASMGSLLLAGGATGCRSALPNATIMLHQPSGGAQGMASDIQIRAQELLRLRSRLNDLYVYHTTEGRKHRIQQAESDKASSSSSSSGGEVPIVTDPAEVLKEIEAVMDRDTFMTAEQALRFGIIDEILIKREEEKDFEE